MTIAFDRTNPWAWYELCKRVHPKDIAGLAAASGVRHIPQAAIEGFQEWEIARSRMSSWEPPRF